VAAEAIHHQMCSILFCAVRQHQQRTQEMGKRGLTPNAAQCASFYHIAGEQHGDHTVQCIATRQQMVEEHGEQPVYSCRQSTRKLLDKYGNHIFNLQPLVSAQFDSLFRHRWIRHSMMLMYFDW